MRRYAILRRISRTWSSPTPLPELPAHAIEEIEEIKEAMEVYPSLIDLERREHLGREVATG
jgi:hypothetical protein